MWRTTDCLRSTRRLHRRLILAAGLTVSVLISGGCGVDLSYLLPLAAGEINILWHSVPLTQAIESSQLTAEQVAKLELILDVRAYARDVVGLTAGGNYTKFYDSGGKAVAFNVSACRRDAFEPRRWTFPIVGTMPYLGFFSRSAAEAKVDELAGAGFDVFMYEVDAYSGAGYFPSVVLSPMLERSDISLADTVLHELLHGTIWRPNDVSFNESLATFFGRTGATRYFADRFPDDADRVQEAADTFEDSDRFSDFMLTLFDELDAFYASDRSSEEKVTGREAVYQAGRERFVAEVQPLMHHPEQYAWVADLPVNNAYMMGIRRYHLDLDVFEDVFVATSEDWAAALTVFREAAGRSDPYVYLRAWIASRDGEASPTDRTEESDAAATPTASRGPCEEHGATTIVHSP